MANPNKSTCKFFTSPRGCNNGNRCKYLHVSPNAGDSSIQSSQRRGAGAAPNSAPTERPRGLPRNACQVFWQQGSCNRSFECKFQHISPSHTDASSPVADDPPDFFSVEGMIATTGIRTKKQHTMSPSEAHNHIKLFLDDTYHFDDVARRVQGFVKIISSINDRNKAWDTDSAQSFLDLLLVKGNGINRIGEVLRFKPVSEHAGLAGQALSFQTGYFPILEYLSSNLVLKSAWQQNVNRLYAVIEDNFDAINDVLQTCIGNMISNKSWEDPSAHGITSTSTSLDGPLVFQTLSTVLLQYVNRFRSAIRNHPELVSLVNNLVDWFDIWAQDVSSTNPVFKDNITRILPPARRLLLDRIREEVDRLSTIIQRETTNDTKMRKPLVPQSSMTVAQRRQASILQFAQTYDPPGDLRPEGKRHDNDHVQISSIRIAPTHEELLTVLPPYLPFFRPEAPHHLQENSMQRHLDIQFRLLREEFMSPIRSSIHAIHGDLTDIWQHGGRNRPKSDLTKLETVLAHKGGPYKGTGSDSAFFFMYTNAEFAPVKAERRDLTVGLVLDAPPGSARESDTNKRQAYWKHSRRLGGGSLVALVIVSRNQLEVYLGVIASGSDDIVESSKASADRIQIRVSFFDPIVELRALKHEKICRGRDYYAFVVDNSVMFEASRPFLESLQTVEPTEIPFARYIPHTSTSLENIPVLPPRYTSSPLFKYKIGSLFTGERKPVDSLDIRNPRAVEEARQHLIQGSCLDPSQVEAMINALRQEVSLIQGPPGTGKSYIGRKILDVLIKSQIQPIILIAFTNHALDHMLTAVLDEKITEKIVRLGSRSSDERISEYSLDKLEKVAQGGELGRSVGKLYATMKQTEERICAVMQSIQLPVISTDQIDEFLEIHYPEHAESFLVPPFWIQALCQTLWAEEEENGEWKKVEGKQKSASITENLSRTYYGIWKDAIDITSITPRTRTAVNPQKEDRGKKKQKAVPNTEITLPEVEDPMITQLFSELGFGNDRPSVPNGDRQIGLLIDNHAVWSMSAVERRRLAEMWEGEIRKLAYDSHLHTYNSLRERYKEVCKEFNDLRDEKRRRLLSKVELIGCTTTGAAKLTSLLTSISPRVIMVEEAGQVLEAHVITALVPSVQHLICIGDPQQLRPTLATYSLSMDSDKGNNLYKFDRSLMERLADGGMPMTQINVQRRMRPTISHFIRKILYPSLEDHDLVTKYPEVQGMSKDVYFLTHTKQESGSEDSVSKFNTYEVEMIRDLVLYFLKQGSYSGPGDIAVLCAYLGQLQKVRQALKDLKISVSVDERDEEQLAKQGMEEDPSTSFEEVMVAKHIRLGTVDIYQGQEAKIVIVSLVRNTGDFDTQSASIGFLKSSNRINVALSRAQHGLYIMGNASNLRKNPTWSTIINELEARDQIGLGFPIRCVRHPEEVHIVSRPREMSVYAPEGGCLLPCGSQLPCGHICPSVCHTVLDGHKSIRCRERCSRTPCPRNHPCERKCSEECGDCLFPIYNVKLPCDHVAEKIPCHMSGKLGDVRCGKMVEKKLPRCEHTAVIPCHQNPASIACKSICGESMQQCCTKACKSQCGDCQKETAKTNVIHKTDRIRRTLHKQHSCERDLYCMHRCDLACHPKEESCNHSCPKSCRQACNHQKCNKPCSVPCPPCMEPCGWRCIHAECPVTCGSICIRLPCDEPCRKTLACGHPCHSVCGEICDTQACLQCLPSEKKRDICDFIMQRRLDDLDLNSEDIAERIITLECGHIFTVETLDGHCDMSSYYEMDTMGRFTSTKIPPTEYQTPPVCPTCRGPISALRYGRVTKRATLDILEQNVANTMSRSLQALNGPFETLSSLVDNKKTEAAKIKGDPSNTKLPSRGRAEESIQKTTAPLSADLLNRGAMHVLHGFSPIEAKAWDQTVKDILDLYRRIEGIACTRGAHVKAYEGALSTLYRFELDVNARSSSPNSEAPQPLAFKCALEKIGQLLPKADVRFQIEAYFRLLELRFILSQIGYSRIEGLAVLNMDEDQKTHRQLWVSFVDLVYASCTADAKKALLMAQASSAPRQAARCSAYFVRSEFEHFRFRTLISLSTLKVSDIEERQIILDSIAAKKTELWVNVGERRRGYLRSRPTGNPKVLQEERKWFDENCAESVDRFVNDLKELKEFAKRGGKYQPVSLQEKQDVLKALGFATTGHFYRCPNGHPFVIGECGGAMETAICPECGAEIGGSSHRLLESNSRDTEFEGMLRNQGGTRPGLVDHPDFRGNFRWL